MSAENSLEIRRLEEGQFVVFVMAGPGHIHFGRVQRILGVYETYEAALDRYKKVSNPKSEQYVYTQDAQEEIFLDKEEITGTYAKFHLQVLG